MLILTRRVGETLMIGDEVSVTVLGVKGNQVRLGVNAPKDIAVHREEIYQRILHERTGDHPHSDADMLGAQDYNRADAYRAQGYQGYDNFDNTHSTPSYPNSGQDRLSLNPERRYPRNSGSRNGVAFERKGGAMSHLRNQNNQNNQNNQGFGGDNAGFNPNFDPFDEDYYNR